MPPSLERGQLHPGILHAGALLDYAPTAQANPGNRQRDISKGDITGVILAGGLGRRMGEQDKGLILLDGHPLVSYVIAALLPQVTSLIISANRNLDSYRTFGYPVVTDRFGKFIGPLAGIASVMQAAATPFVLSAPCDSPRVTPDLGTRLSRASRAANADISAAYDGKRIQPLFALLRRDLLSDLLDYLTMGQRKVDAWYARHRLALADFSDCPQAFLNINGPQELRALQAGRQTV